MRFVRTLAVIVMNVETIRTGIQSALLLQHSRLEQHSCFFQPYFLWIIYLIIGTFTMDEHRPLD